MNLLIIDPFPQAFIDKLATLPLEINYLVPAEEDQIRQKLDTCDMLLMNSRIKLDPATIALASRLKLVIRAGVGMDHIDMDYLKKKGISAVNTAGANADAVGEQTVGMLLSLLHHIHRADKQVRNLEWIREPNRGSELQFQVVGIIGYGHTGQAVARRLSGFGCRILAYDKYKTDYGHPGIEEVQLDTIFEEASIVTFHVPLTAETHYWADHRFFERFRHPIYLLNLSRGPVVHLGDLLKALSTGKVLAAGLDVLENEKLDRLTSQQQQWYQDLFASDKVVLTPHIGGWTVESLQNIQDMIWNYIQNFLETSAQNSALDASKHP